MAEITEAIPATPATPSTPSLPAEASIPSEPIKPGIVTTEFWTTIAATVIPSIVTLFVWLNVVPGDVQTTVSDSLLAVVNGLISLIAVWKYISSRKEVKLRYLDQKNINRQFLFGLWEKGLVSSEVMHREFNIPKAMARSGDLP